MNLIDAYGNGMLIQFVQNVNMARIPFSDKLSNCSLEVALNGQFCDEFVNNTQELLAVRQQTKSLDQCKPTAEEDWCQCSLWNYSAKA